MNWQDADFPDFRCIYTSGSFEKPQSRRNQHLLSVRALRLSGLPAMKGSDQQTLLARYSDGGMPNRDLNSRENCA